MKKTLLINIAAFIIMSFQAASSADSLSTSKTIRLYLRVVPKAEMEYDGTVDRVSLDKSKEPETPPDTKPFSNPPQRSNSSPFTGIGRSIRNIFFSLADPSRDMQRKY